MASTIYTPLKPTLGYRLHKKLTKMYWYHYNDTTFLNATKIPMSHSLYNFKNLKLIAFRLPDYQPAIRPGYTSAMAPVFLHSKSNTLDLQSFCSNELLSTVLWCFLLSFITYKAFVLKSLANLQISVDKLVGKLLINLLNHT